MGISQLSELNGRFFLFKKTKRSRKMGEEGGRMIELFIVTPTFG
jgi:hypothetical protein